MKSLYAYPINDTQFWVIDIDRNPQIGQLALVKKNDELIIKKFEVNDEVVGLIVGKYKYHTPPAPKT